MKQEYWGAYFEGNTQHISVPWVRGYSIVASCQSHNCWPDFMPAEVTEGRDGNGNPTWNWEKLVYNKDSSCNRVPNATPFRMFWPCRNLAEEEECSGGYMISGQCEYPQNPGCTPGTWGFAHPEYECTGVIVNCECSVNGGLQGDPVLVDPGGDGFALTSQALGVSFDIDANGEADRIAWTAAGSDDGWLALDRNGDGRITSGTELFGDFTPQPAPPPGQVRHGFLALAEFDKAARGGNGDGVIDSRDAVFPSLRLWQDANHDAVSDSGELHALPTLDVARLHLDCKESKRVDEHGNQFRYRAKVDDAKGAKVNRWAWDVFLKAAP